MDKGKAGKREADGRERQKNAPHVHKGKQKTIGILIAQITKWFQIEDSLKQSSFSQINSDVNIQSNGMMVVLKREREKKKCFLFSFK